MSYKPFFTLLLSAFALLLAAAAEARACSCGRQKTVLDAYDHADFVLIASAVSVEKAPPEKAAPAARA